MERRKDAWRVMVHAGRDPVTGRKRLVVLLVGALATNSRAGGTA